MSDPIDESSAGGSEAARERAAALIGRTISDRYKILDLIAMGGMGAVYRAEHLLMRKHVAVKVLHPEVEGFPELVERFEREAVAGAHVNHPNVASASDFGTFDGESRFLVLELIQGSTLRELMTHGPIPAVRALRIVRQVAAALTAVHAKGIVHRDLKPRNIMIIGETRHTIRVSLHTRGAEDVVKLIDFGLSKVPVEQLSLSARDADGDRRSLTAAGVIMGTVGYLAPEAAFGMRSVLAPADLYSLGVVFYEMLCGASPFDGANDMELFARHRKAPVPPIAERNPEVSVPAEIEAVVRRLLEKDPGRRYADAEALVEAIDGVLASTTADPGPSLAELAAAANAASMRPEADIAIAKEEDVAKEADVAKEGAIRSRRTGWIVALLVAVAGVVAVIVSRTGEPPALDSAAASSVLVAPASAIASAVVAPMPPRAPSVVERLHAAAETRDSANAVAVFIEIADKNPAAFADRAVQTEAADVAEIAAAGGRAADPIFDRLAGQLGADGLDVLYDLVAREQNAGNPLERTGLTAPTSAGPRARAILGRPDVLARATPAMRVAYELRRAPCQSREILFPRAATDGDDRALSLLTLLQPPACSRKDACCFLKHRELERAIAEIQMRLRH
ncbi:MAG: serine/threonine-protein kinase [Byssovorax sp.]